MRIYLQGTIIKLQKFKCSLYIENNTYKVLQKKKIEVLNLYLTIGLKTIKKKVNK